MVNSNNVGISNFINFTIIHNLVFFLINQLPLQPIAGLQLPMSDVTSPRFARRLWRGLGAAAATGLAAWWAWSVRRTKRVKVAALYVYPIKSCRGHSMGKATVTKWGLEDDRTMG
jgi:hypothetical protein